MEGSEKGRVVLDAHLTGEVDLVRLDARVGSEAAGSDEAVRLALEVRIELRHVGVGVVVHLRARDEGGAAQGVMAGMRSRQFNRKESEGIERTKKNRRAAVTERPCR